MREPTQPALLWAATAAAPCAATTGKRQYPRRAAAAPARPCPPCCCAIPPAPRPPPRPIGGHPAQGHPCSLLGALPGQVICPPGPGPGHDCRAVLRLHVHPRRARAHLGQVGRALAPVLVLAGRGGHRRLGYGACAVFVLLWGVAGLHWGNGSARALWRWQRARGVPWHSRCPTPMLMVGGGHACEEAWAGGVWEQHVRAAVARPAGGSAGATCPVLIWSKTGSAHAAKKVVLLMQRR